MLVYSYGQEIEDVLKNQRNDNDETERLKAADHLQLCLKHKQEKWQSHYSPDNCHYCELKRKYDKLGKTLEMHRHQLREGNRKRMSLGN